MFFKGSTQPKLMIYAHWSLACVLMLGFFIGCGLKTGEDAHQDQPPSFSGEGFSCVGQIPQHLDRYIKDQLSVNEINAFISCMQKSFTTFAQLTRGQDQNSYSPQEIRAFLQRYFFKERPITDELLAEFMLIKQTIVGGSLERIRREELAIAVEVLEEIRVEALRMKPHLKILNPKLVSDLEPLQIQSQVQLAQNDINQTILTLTKRLSQSKKPYRFENLNRFLVEFRHFIRWEDTFPNSRKAEPWVELFRVFHKIAVNPKAGGGISPNEWSPFLSSISRWYLAYIQFAGGVNTQSIIRERGLENLMHVAHQVFTLSEEAISRHPERVIPFAEISSLMEVAQKMGWISARVRKQSIDQAVHAFIAKIFGDPSLEPSKRKSPGLNLFSLALMKSEFYRWAYIQRALIEQFLPQSQSLALATFADLGEDPGSGLGAWSVLGDTTGPLQFSKSADYQEFLQVKELMRPLYREGFIRVHVMPFARLKSYGIEHGFFNLSAMNLLRSATTLIFRGYADSGFRFSWTSGIRSGELQGFYEDFRDLGIDLGMVDSRNKKAGARSFIEGNLFTFSSDGFSQEDDQTKGQLSFVETMELLGFLYSGGNLADTFYQEMLALPKCTQAQAPKDLHNRPKLPRACVAEALVQMIPRMVWNMPSFRDDWYTLTAAAQWEFVQNLLNAAQNPKESDRNWVELSELATMSVILHYAEAVMTRFDLNHDNVLSNREVHEAVPVFSGFIRKFARENLKVEMSKARARGAFLYILHHHEMPNRSNVLSIWDLSLDLRASVPVPFLEQTWEIDFNRPLRVTRKDLSTVFCVFISRLAETQD